VVTAGGVSGGTGAGGAGGVGGEVGRFGGVTASTGFAGSTTADGAAVPGLVTVPAAGVPAGGESVAPDEIGAPEGGPLGGTTAGVAAGLAAGVVVDPAAGTAAAGSGLALPVTFTGSTACPRARPAVRPRANSAET